ncbi:hypothetical protein HSBAA_PA_2480 (plasmid) [Vreelandella sulfidaeris]|uniref:EamA domain-containing protein n=1 Tax=Vreelandella sulfidaeris TaxID=115553 RepID=A0A455UHM6_9GAMM|nr:hypothetical protein HSBAA_PA_2480 [Halomonas sulfidaeris]
MAFRSWLPWGGNIAAATNPMLLGIVFEGASGTRLILVVTGLLLVQAIQLNNLTLSKQPIA